MINILTMVRIMNFSNRMRKNILYPIKIHLHQKEHEKIAKYLVETELNMRILSEQTILKKCSTINKLMMKKIRTRIMKIH